MMETVNKSNPRLNKCVSNNSLHVPIIKRPNTSKPYMVFFRYLGFSYISKKLLSLCINSIHQLKRKIGSVRSTSFSPHNISLIIKNISFALGLVWISISSIFSQSISVSGVVIDAETREGIPYATLRLNGTNHGTLSNKEGYFSWTLSQSIIRAEGKVVISSIGYENVQLSWREIQKSGPVQIALTPKSYSVAHVYIYATDFTAREMVKTAINRIPKNYYTEPYILQTFYRHYCKEKGEYGRLIEAGIDIYDPKGHRKRYKKPEKKVRAEVKQLRRSFDFTRFSALNHAPISLFQVLQQDIASYDHYLSKNIGNNKVSFQFIDTTFYDNQIVFVIQALYKSFYKADIYVTAEDLAIIKLKETISTRRKEEFRHFNQQLNYDTEYRRYGDRYFLNRLVNEGQQKTIFLDSLGVTVYEQDHAHHVELTVNNIETDNVNKIKGMKLDAASLNSIPFRPNFWKNYTVLAPTPLEKQIEEDLAARMPLQKQFQQVNEPDIETVDFLTNRAFDNILSENQDKHILIYIWESGSLPKIKELLLARKLIKSYQGSPVSLVFLSVDKSEEEWRKAIAFRGMYAGYNLRLPLRFKSQIAQKYGITQSPHYLIISPGGDILLNTNKLPGKSTIKELLKDILVN